MGYLIEYRGLEGQTRKARIQRKNDGYWWDEISAIWIAAATYVCDITLTESTTEIGLYTATAGASPQDGGIYVIDILDSADALVIRTEDAYQSPQNNALEIVNEVQRELRLPQSSLITEPHAAFILGFVNKAKTLMMEGGAWPEHRVEGAIALQAGISVYSIFPVNKRSLETLENLSIGDDPPLEIIKDSKFRIMSKSYSDQNQPIYFRIYSRVGGGLVIEVLPTPDQTYQLDFFGYMDEKNLSAATDVPLVDATTLSMGALAMAKNEEGLNASADFAAFNAKHAGRSETQGGMTHGGVEIL